MSDGLQLHSIALPDVAELQASTSSHTTSQPAAHTQPAANAWSDDSDW
jgi:hypothetical protein